MVLESATVEMNREHYDRIYDAGSMDHLVQKGRDPRRFLSEVRRASIGWEAMYYGNLDDRLVGKRVLELGSGDGLNAVIMARLGAARVVAVDISEASARHIDALSDKLDLDNVTALSGDFESMELPRMSFDFVMGKGFLHHLTHSKERAYLERAASILDAEGEARFFEPATNSGLLDWLRWMVPVPGRPSSLSRRAFAEWRNNDPHPQRDNSSDHFLRAGLRFFDRAEMVSFGSIERFQRLLPAGNWDRRFRIMARRIESCLPEAVLRKAARCQLLIYRCPRAARRSARLDLAHSA